MYRVARGFDPFLFRAPLSPLPTQDTPVLDGNRWDDPLGKYATLYCASTAEAAFGETIARYREREGLLDRISSFLSDDPDPDYDFDLHPARIPPDYFVDRYLGRVMLIRRSCSLTLITRTPMRRQRSACDPYCTSTTCVWLTVE